MCLIISVSTCLIHSRSKSQAHRPLGSNTAEQLVSTEERRQADQTQVSQGREHVELEEVAAVQQEDR